MNNKLVLYLLLFFSLFSGVAKGQDYGTEGTLTGGDITATFIWPDGSTITTDANGHYDADGGGGTLVSTTPQQTYTNANFIGDVMGNNGVIYTFTNNTVTQYVYAQNANGGWSLINSNTNQGEYTPAGINSTTGVSTGGYIVNTNGSYTLSYTDGSSLTMNTDGTYTISAGSYVCTGCTSQAASAGLPPGIAQPPLLPPNPTLEEREAYSAAMNMYMMATHASPTTCPTGQYKDSCGRCVGGSSGLLPCKKDCAGKWGGVAYLDSCGKCVGGTTGKLPCKKDCAGKWGGTAAKDSCGKCTGGTTNILPCNKIPCETDSTLNVTGAMLKKINSTGIQALMDSAAKYINLYMKDYGINTRLRLAYFLANASEETDNFTHFTEGWNYNQKNLIDLWPKKFDTSNAATYAGKSIALDRAYADDGNATLHNNGNEASKDGSTYRGRGLFHLTHRDSYYRFTNYYKSKYTNTTTNFETTPDSVASNVKYAVLSALWEYGIDKSKTKAGKDKPRAHNALLSADDDDIENVTAIINGGDNGLEIRRAKLKLAKKQLCL